MLVIGGIEGAGRQQDDRRLRARARRRRTQAGEQLVGVVVDRGDAMAGEQVGHQPHRHLAVLQHVGDPGGGAGVVLQHVELALADPDDVDAGDQHPEVVRRPAADHFRSVVGIAQDQLVGDDLLLQRRARAVDVLEEQVERGDALDEALFEEAPLGAGNDARHDVERDQPLGGVLVAVDAEGDADAAEHVFRLGAAGGENVGGRFLEPAGDVTVDRPRFAGADAHFVKRRRRPPCRSSSFVPSPHPSAGKRMFVPSLAAAARRQQFERPPARHRLARRPGAEIRRRASIAADNRRRYSSREISTAPSAARWGVTNCASSRRKPPSLQPRDEMDQRDLGGVARAMEHALAEEGRAEADAVEAADQLAALVGLDRMGAAEREQRAIERGESRR